MEDKIKRWTTKRKSALVLDIIQGKTSHWLKIPPSRVVVVYGDPTKNSAIKPYR